MKTKLRAFIVKVQKPLMSTDKTSPWLFYDENRTIYEQFPEMEVPKEVVGWFKDVETHKAYYEAHIGSDGKLILDWPTFWLNADGELSKCFGSDLAKEAPEW